MKAIPPAAIPCRTAAPRSRTRPRRRASCWSRKPRGVSMLPAENLRTENGAVISPDGQRLGYGDLVAADMLHVQAQPKSKLKDPGDVQGDGPTGPARRYPGQGHRRRCLCPGHAAAGHGACPRGTAAELWRATDGVRYGSDRKTCPASSRSIRDGNFLAVAAKKEFQAIKAMQALSAAAKWKETASLPKQDDLAARPDRPAVAGFDHLPAQQSVGRRAARPSRPPTRGPISRTGRSGRPARWRIPPMA